MSRGYGFGDSELAAERLRRLADVFEAPSRAFLRAAAPQEVGLALDLGCGPGRTTRLVAETTGAARTLGLDASPEFVARARAGAPPGVAFAVHDVVADPLPGPPADLAYARFLASHLADPGAAIGGWVGGLRSGGRLLLDEVEWIRTGVATFRRYLDLVEAMLEARGQRLFVGERLEALAEGAGRRLSSVLTEHTVSARDAAALFSMNLVGFRGDPAVRARASEDALDALAAELAAVRDGERGAEDPRWGLRQLALEA